MEKKTYRIAPYEKENWQWLWGAAGITFLCWCFSDYLWFDMAAWGYGMIFSLSCLLLGLFRIRQRGVELFLSEDGIRVRNHGRDTVPLTPWSAFDSGYIFKLFAGALGAHQDADTYFLLTAKPLDQELIDKIAFALNCSKPCGVWKDYIAVRTKAADNRTIRTAIGSQLPLTELCIDREHIGEATKD